MPATHCFLLVCLCAQLLVASSKIAFSHNLVLYDCDPNSLIYQFHYNKSGKATLHDLGHGAFKLSEPNGPNAQYEVTINKSNLKGSRFQFNITSEELDVEVRGELRKCDQSSADCKCTILVSILASLSLLLFAALAVTLIVLKEKRVPCFDKILHWWRMRSHKEQPPNSGLDLDNLRRIHENSLKQEFQPEPDIEDSPPNISINFPRKSSLKPPRVEAFPIPQVTENNISIDPSTVRRKSIVTFNERTEIRS